MKTNTIWFWVIVISLVLIGIAAVHVIGGDAYPALQGIVPVAEGFSGSDVSLAAGDELPYKVYLSAVFRWKYMTWADINPTCGPFPIWERPPDCWYDLPQAIRDWWTGIYGQ